MKILITNNGRREREIEEKLRGKSKKKKMERECDVRKKKNLTAMSEKGWTYFSSLH